mgnify:CR=1 FL=1
MNEKPTYFVEKTYYNLDKSESVVIKIPHDTDFSRPPREVKRLGIWCSGGADSTALLYLLAKTIKDNDLDVYIQPMTVRRQRPWNPIKAKPVIDKVYPFSESIEAFTHLASGRAKGKIVIKIA